MLAVFDGVVAFYVDEFWKSQANHGLTVNIEGLIDDPLVCRALDFEAAVALGQQLAQPAAGGSGAREWPAESQEARATHAWRTP